MFVITLWFLSRLVIVVAMQTIAPILHTPPTNHSYLHLGFVPNYVPVPGWELFSHWDGAWYRTIATSGYGYPDSKHSKSLSLNQI